MRRRTLLVALAGLAAAITVAATWLWTRTNPVTRENYARTALGMSRSEVCAILGSPYDYTYGEANVFGARLEGKLHEEDLPETWTADGCQIWMFFDQEGKVTARSCCLCQAASVSLRKKLLWHYYRLRQKWFG
jgi:hypothetical protein